jgi:ribosomal-protein-alanine N-acetyltransferase
MIVQLKYWKLEYAEQLALIANNKNIAMFMRNQFPYPYSLADAINYIEWINKEYPLLVFAIECDGVVVGSIGVFPGDDVYCASAELGYWIGQEYWGRGIATQALRQLLDYVFNNFSFNKIRANVFSNNLKSMHVLVKCGFMQEAILQKAVYKYEQYLDEHLYAIFNPNFES